MSIARRVLQFPLTRLVIALVVFGLLAAPALLWGFEHLEGWVVQLALVVAAAIALFVVVRCIERKPFFATVLPPEAGARELATGFAFGAGLFIAVVGVLAVCGWFRLTGLQTPGGAAVGLVLRTLGLFLSVAIVEELLFR